MRKEDAVDQTEMTCEDALKLFGYDSLEGLTKERLHKDYRRLSLGAHPDKVRDDGTAFKNLVAAYDFIYKASFYSNKPTDSAYDECPMGKEENIKKFFSLTTENRLAWIVSYHLERGANLHFRDPDGPSFQPADVAYKEVMHHFSEAIDYEYGRLILCFDPQKTTAMLCKIQELVVAAETFGEAVRNKGPSDFQPCIAMIHAHASSTPSYRKMAFYAGIFLISALLVASFSVFITGCLTVFIFKTMALQAVGTSLAKSAALSSGCWCVLFPIQVLIPRGGKFFPVKDRLIASIEKYQKAVKEPRHVRQSSTQQPPLQLT